MRNLARFACIHSYNIYIIDPESKSALESELALKIESTSKRS